MVIMNYFACCIFCSALVLKSADSCKRFVPDEEEAEIYPHLTEKEIEFPALSPDPNRREFTSGYNAAPYHNNIDDGCTCGKHNTLSMPTLRIIGGKDADKHEYPYQAALVMTNSRRSICGGTLINDQFVLTAAHCVLNLTSAATITSARYLDIQVLLQAHQINTLRDTALYMNMVKGKPYEEGLMRADMYDEVIRRSSAKIIPHPGFRLQLQKYYSKLSPIPFDNDIALIKLSEPVPLDGRNGPWTSCLPDSDKFDRYPNKKGVAIGWGLQRKDDPASFAQTLQELDIPILSEEECKRRETLFPVPIHFVCVEPTPTGRRKDIGQGDSGGPLLLKNSLGQFEQIGLVSFAPKTARGTKPRIYSAYTRITEYLPWIYKQIQDEEKTGTVITWCRTK